MPELEESNVPQKEFASALEVAFSGFKIRWSSSERKALKTNLPLFSGWTQYLEFKPALLLNP
jgi:hypothetical protein